MMTYVGSSATCDVACCSSGRRADIKDGASVACWTCFETATSELAEARGKIEELMAEIKMLNASRFLDEITGPPGEVTEHVRKKAAEALGEMKADLIDPDTIREKGGER